MLRSLRRLLPLAAPLLLPGAAAYGLTRQLPLPSAIACHLGAFALLALVGCLLLGSTSVQSRSFRHLVAGLCLPFAQGMGGGSLPRVWLSSLLGTAAVGGSVFLFVFLQQRTALPPWPLAAGLCVDGLTLLWLATAQTRPYRYRAPSPARGRLIYLLVWAQITLATALHLRGEALLALLVAVVPQALLALREAMLLVTLLTVRRTR